MTTKMTRKAVLAAGGDRVICVPYCAADSLLRYAVGARIGYTEGVYGWNADVYQMYTNDFETVYTIVTGYRPFGARLDHDLLQHVDELFEQLRGDCPWHKNPHEFEYRKFAASALISIHDAGNDPEKIAATREAIDKEFHALPRVYRIA